MTKVEIQDMINFVIVERAKLSEDSPLRELYAQQVNILASALTSASA